MANDQSRDNRAKDSNLGTHPNGVNPSAPTAGTEGWGTTPDERRVLTPNEPQNTRDGQMKGNPGDSMRAASQREEASASSNKGRSDVNNHADLSKRTSASSHSMNANQGGTAHSFRCADVGNPDCKWETQGDSEDEVMKNVVEHQRNAHGLSDWTDALHDRVRGSIHRRNAA